MKVRRSRTRVRWRLLAQEKFLRRLPESPALDSDQIQGGHKRCTRPSHDREPRCFQRRIGFRQSPRARAAPAARPSFRREPGNRRRCEEIPARRLARGGARNFGHFSHWRLRAVDGNCRATDGPVSRSQTAPEGAGVLDWLARGPWGLVPRSAAQLSGFQQRTGLHLSSRGQRRRSAHRSAFAQSAQGRTCPAFVQRIDAQERAINVRGQIIRPEGNCTVNPLGFPFGEWRSALHRPLAANRLAGACEGLNRSETPLPQSSAFCPCAGSENNALHRRIQAACRHAALKKTIQDLWHCILSGCASKFGRPTRDSDEEE